MVISRHSGIKRIMRPCTLRNAGTVDDLRNNDQEKYHPCDKCVHGSAASQVYLTDYGNRYHNSLSCSGLKRTVYAIPVSEAVGKGACTKCSK